MVSRRTRARLRFIFECLSLSNQVNRRRTDNDIEPIRKRWFLLGAAYRITLKGWQDKDVGGIRTNRWHRSLLLVVLFGIGTVAGSRSWDSRRDFSLGASSGYICYRFWYGVLRPLPGCDS